MPAQPEDESKRKVNIVSIRGSKEWREWIHRFRACSRTGSTADLIDQALVELAKTKGFDEPPPPR